MNILHRVNEGHVTKASLPSYVLYFSLHTEDVLKAEMHSFAEC